MTYNVSSGMLNSTIPYDGDPDPPVDSGSLIHLLHNYGIGDFCTFVSISYTVNGRLVPYLVK